MVKNNSTSLALVTSPVLAELPPLITEKDFHIGQLTLNLLSIISVSHIQGIHTIQKVLKLTRVSPVPGLAHSDLLALLVNPVLGRK